jgi:hypothetical protein
MAATSLLLALLDIDQPTDFFYRELSEEGQRLLMSLLYDALSRDEIIQHYLAQALIHYQTSPETMDALRAELSRRIEGDLPGLRRDDLEKIEAARTPKSTT